jgi:hypothetical protein
MANKYKKLGSKSLAIKEMPIKTTLRLYLRPVRMTIIKKKSSEIEASIDASGPDRFIGEFYQIIKEELMVTLLRLFHEIEREGTLPKLFCEVSITLIPKEDKDTAKKREL